MYFYVLSTVSTYPLIKAKCVKFRTIKYFLISIQNSYSRTEMYNLIKRRFVREGSSCKYFFQPLENFHYLTKKKKEKNTESRKLESKVSLFLKTKQKER